ncbi:MAG: pilin [bacterium]|nr:pilin [bacterium]
MLSKIKNIVFATVLAVSGLAVVTPTVDATTGTSGGQSSSVTSGGLRGGIDTGATDNTRKDLFGDGGIFTTIINVMLFIIGALSVIMLIYGGIRYTISRGDSGEVNNAKNTILYAIVGLIVSILAYAIVNFVVTEFQEK